VRRPILIALATIAVAGSTLSACGGSSSDDTAGGSTSNSATSSSRSAVSGQITVLAAASLTGSFTKLGQQFESTHPGTKITFSFGPSSGLSTQIANGAPADVFASASPKNMDSLVTSKAVQGTPVNFAKNVMEIAVPPNNPGKIAQLSDLAK
jgi:molybdate transport system substrate-binding protein